ncbi:VOC family protein [Psychroserpens sp.]|uniref:VOC family protein n=1 Tax=Psychroserpens sp. TaxID=2020870 RepID=UPI001B251578|nr:VOC family protein [Psychroserpens sp.]MBO6605342.1 VOC family protein [Psychroserpens sp.]MBO6629975.1 VOC family protein [Psychroserpens sp.]MBO6653849.1 VOC family protein [Psychroserpens sp.]MBO6682170.1 VOC family protein [Psychroserpens sp.]MBO6748716.1 VOC family protein [Psychroserpens sp.]
MNKLAPQFIVDHLKSSVTFYTEKLGFKVDWMNDHDPKFVILNREGVVLMLRQLSVNKLARPNRIPFIDSGWHTEGAEAWDAYIWMDDVETFYDQCIAHNVSIVKKLQLTDYGNLDFEIEDPDGYILCFGKIIKN